MALTYDKNLFIPDTANAFSDIVQVNLERHSQSKEKVDFGMHTIVDIRKFTSL